MTDDTPTPPENKQGDPIDARNSKGFVNRPTGPVKQFFGTVINIGNLQIPIYLLLICLIGIFAAVAYPVVKSWLPTPRAFAPQSDGETLIVIATFHGQAAAADEPHTQIRRAIAAEAAKQGEWQLRVVEEPTELTADQRKEAEDLGNRYNASIVIWGEVTRVGIIVNFLNLREPDIDAATAVITETERTELADPSAYTRFITNDLPKTMSFFAFFALGQSYYLDTQYALAIERIEAAVALLPPDTKPEGLVNAYFRLGWLNQVPTPNNLNQAIANYNKAIQLDPTYAAVYNNRGIAFFAQRRWAAAAADYDKAIQLNPTYATAFNNRGISFSVQGKSKEAIADYDKAIQLNPTFAAAYYNRGTSSLYRGELREAIADYDKSIQLNPENTLTYNNRGYTLSEQGKLAEAIADFDMAIQLDPTYANAFLGRGLAFRNLGREKKALSDFQHYLELQPNAPNRTQVEQWIAEIEAEIAKQK